MKHNNENENISKVFKSIGLEKPSADFTLLIMERVAEQKVLQTEVRKVRFYKYFVFFPLILIPLFIPTIFDWISKIKIDFSYLNLGSLKTMLMQLFNNFQFTVSPAIISIFISSLVLIGLFAVINYKQPENTSVQ